MNAKPQLATPPALDTSWMNDAACRQLNPMIFFPSDNGSTNTAKAVCAICPVRDDCGDYAAATKSVGVWDGRNRTGTRKTRTRIAAELRTSIRRAQMMRADGLTLAEIACHLDVSVTQAQNYSEGRSSGKVAL